MRGPTHRPCGRCLLTPFPLVLLILLLPSAEQDPDAGHMPPSVSVLDSLLECRSYAEVERRGRELLDEAETAGSPDPAGTVEILDRLVAALRSSGRGHEPDALRWAGRAVALRESLNGPESPKTAGSLFALGAVLWARGEHDVAVAPY